jgi:hypothetical protein
MSTNQHQQITRELRIPQTDDRISLREEAKACESCDRRKDVIDDETGELKGLCLASQGKTWQEMSRMEPSVGGCGSQKVKWRAKV